MIRDVVIGKDDVKKAVVGDKKPLTIIAGPCAIESEEHSMRMAEAIAGITEKLGIQYVFKSCYNKDCRSSIKSFHGVGLEEGLAILEKVRKTFGVPVTCDVSNAEWMDETAAAVDLIQIPAYLSRQSHLLIAAGETGLPVLSLSLPISTTTRARSLSNLTSSWSISLILFLNSSRDIA